MQSHIIDLILILAVAFTFLHDMVGALGRRWMDIHATASTYDVLRAGCLQTRDLNGRACIC
jgi:hypothetical protein